MKCPCCQNEMYHTYVHLERSNAEIEPRHYNFYVCQSGGQYCNGLIAKHDMIDHKVTFVTPGHSVATLHVNYINSVFGDDLLKSIFSTFEWCAYKGY